MKTKRFLPYSYKANDAMLFVTAYQEGRLEGRLSHPLLDAPQKIQSVPQMLFLLEELLSREDLLLSYPGSSPLGETEVPPLATLRLQILFREHYTWQGCVHWVEGEKSLPFRSVLELIQILDELLTD